MVVRSYPDDPLRKMVHQAGKKCGGVFRCGVCDLSINISRDLFDGEKD